MGRRCPHCSNQASVRLSSLRLRVRKKNTIEVYWKDIEARALGWLQHEVDLSVKLYLQHGRREPQKDKPPTQKTLYLRHWSRTKRSNFTLAVDPLAYLGKVAVFQPVPRAENFCHFCIANCCALCQKCKGRLLNSILLAYPKP
jgi:hypothetical protein